jgi:hypothetical protein
MLSIGLHSVSTGASTCAGWIETGQILDEHHSPDRGQVLTVPRAVNHFFASTSLSVPSFQRFQTTMALSGQFSTSSWRRRHQKLPAHHNTLLRQLWRLRRRSHAGMKKRLRESNYAFYAGEIMELLPRLSYEEIVTQEYAFVGTAERVLEQCIALKRAVDVG